MVLVLDFKKQLLPHLIAVIVFLGVAAMFFSPIIFEGKAIDQHDILQGAGSNQELINFRQETGEEGLWTNSMFSGMPAYLINVRWQGDLLLYVQDVMSLWLPSPVRHIFAAFVCFYILLVVMGVRPYLAIAGALAYGLNTFNMVSLEAGHNWKVGAIAFMPLVLAGFHLLIQGKWKWGFILATLALALEIRNNHLQITYYVFLLLLFMGVAFLIEVLKSKDFKRLAFFALFAAGATFLSVGSNFGKLWGTYEYSKFSTRGPSDLTNPSNAQSGPEGLDRDYVFNYSYDIAETLTLFIPYFYGGASVESVDMDSPFAKALQRQGIQRGQVRQITERVYTYWGQQPFTAGPTYAGTCVIFLFVVGLLFANPKQRYWLLAATIFSMVLSWGKNFESFNYLMFDYFPYYNKFRSVTMSISIAMVTIPLLGFLGLERLLELPWSEKHKKRFYYAAGISLGTGLLFILFAGLGSYRAPVDTQLGASYPDWFMSALREQRMSLLRGDAIRSFIFILLLAASVYLYKIEKIKELVLYVGVIFLVTVDLWTVNKRYLPNEDYERSPARNIASPSPADQRIMQDTDLHFRVLNLANPFNEARTSYFHSSLGGYHGAKMKRYQELISRCLNEELREIIESNGDLSQASVMNMLNAKYLLAGQEANAVLVNPEARGNAWFASDLSLVNSADEEIDATCEAGDAMAVVDVSRFTLSQTEFNGQGTINLEEYRPNYLMYVSNVSDRGLALFSEIYYPKGWTARIDGIEVPILRANYVLRALEVPAGEHTIEFSFKPAAYHVGNKVMLGSSLLIVLLLVGAIGMEVRTLIS